MVLSPKDQKPRAYIDGEVEFYDLNLKVSQACLIPRLESELLVERALKRFPQEGIILDLCTGSGALGLAIKRQRPSLKVVLADISKEAISLALENAKSNALIVEIFCGDFFDAVSGMKFDGIICNPPYITKDEYQLLQKSVKDYEPKIALTDDADGLTFYRRLAVEAPSFLREGAYLCVEIGKDQAEAVLALFSEEIWVNKKVEKDYSSHDRFFFLEKRVRGL